MKRFAEIKNARAMGILGGSTNKALDDWMIALLAPGRVSDLRDKVAQARAVRDDLQHGEML